MMRRLLRRRPGPRGGGNGNVGVDIRMMTALGGAHRALGAAPSLVHQRESRAKVRIHQNIGVQPLRLLCGAPRARLGAGESAVTEGGSSTDEGSTDGASTGCSTIGEDGGSTVSGAGTCT